MKYEAVNLHKLTDTYPYFIVYILMARNSRLLQNVAYEQEQYPDKRQITISKIHKFQLL